MVEHVRLHPREKGASRRFCGQGTPVWANSRIVCAWALALLVLIVGQGKSFAQTDASAAQAGSQGTSNAELLEQIKEMRSEIKSLRDRLDAKESPAHIAPAQTEPAVSNSTTPGQEQSQTQAAPQEQGRPQYTGRVDNANVAMATKANGGDLSG